MLLEPGAAAEDAAAALQYEWDLVVIGGGSGDDGAFRGLHHGYGAVVSGFDVAS